MDRRTQVGLCKQCIHHKFDSKSGIICGLTNSIQKFEKDCVNFAIHDRKEFNVIEKFEKRFLERGGSKLELHDFENEDNKELDGAAEKSNDDNVQISNDSYKITCKIKVIKYRSDFICKFRRQIRNASFLFIGLFIAVLNMSFFDVFEMITEWGLNVSIDFELYFLVVSIFFGSLAILINFLNTKSINGAIQLSEDIFEIKTDNERLELKIKDINTITMSHAFHMTVDYFKYSVIIDFCQKQKSELIFQFTDQSNEGKKLRDFLFKDKRIKTFQE